MRRYAWAIPSERALAAIARYGPIVEIAAGTGYWARLLRERGVDIIAYDKTPPDGSDRNRYHRGAICWTEVRRGGITAIDAHPDRSLLLCWPPRWEQPQRGDGQSPVSHFVVRRYRGDTVIYIGEPGPRATGSLSLWRRLRREWELTDEVAIPQWDVAHDRLMVWRRRPS